MNVTNAATLFFLNLIAAANLDMLVLHFASFTLS